MCRAPLREEGYKREAEGALGLDMKKIPIGSSLRIELEGQARLGKISNIPRILIRILARRISGNLWVKLAFRGTLALYRKTSFKDDPGAPVAKIKAVTSELRKRGFIPVMDRILDSYVPPLRQRLFANKNKKLFACASFPKQGIEEIKIMAVPPEGGRFVIASNTSGEIITDPKSIYSNLPGKSVAELVARVEREVPAKARKGWEFNMRLFATALAAVHKRAVESAIEKGLLTRIKKGAEPEQNLEIGVLPQCAAHPGVTAIRRCGLCGKPICGVCHVYYEGHDYCRDCLSQEAEAGAVSPLDFSGELRPAGFAVRGAVKIMETAGLLFLIVSLFPESAAPGSKIAYQFIALVSFIAYFHIPVAKWGATPLQRAAGLSVISFYGEPLPRPSVVVRTGYYLLTLITIVPLIGYLSALWDPYRRGAHDHMAGTVVVTANEKTKAKAGAAVLVVALALAAYNVSFFRESFDRIINVAFGLPPGGIIRSGAVWERPTLGEARLIGENSAAAVTGRGVTAYNLTDGSAIWASPVKGAQRLYPDPFSDYIYVFGPEDGATAVTAVSKQKGEAVWRLKVEDAKLAAPVFHSHGLSSLTDGGEIVTLSRDGKLAWRRKPEGVVKRLFAGGDLVLARMVKNGEPATLALATRDGSEKAFMLGLSPVMPEADSKFLLSGALGAMLYDFRLEEDVWSAVEPLSFTGERPEKGGYYFSSRKAIRKDNGDAAYDYPEGCVYAGVFDDMIALACAGEDELRVIRAGSWVEMGRFKGIAYGRVVELGKDMDGYRLTAYAKAPAGRVHALILSFAKNLKSVESFDLGVFEKEPQIKYFPGQIRIFLSSDDFAGVYRTPWKPGA